MRKILTCLLCLSILLGVLSSCADKLPQGINNPSSDYVVKSLQKIPLITEIESVTERNDPNGNLNKKGGYTAQVYFSYALVDQEEFDEKSVIDKGTDCGGSVEVYRTEKDAKKRDNYLSSFDGGPVASGSHTVVGTVVVRTSCKLTASQQRSLEYDIIAALKGEDDKINKTNPYEEDFEILKRSVGVNLTPQAVIDYCQNKNYNKAEIGYILDNCGVNWGTQASRRIEAYADAWSGLRKQDVYDIMTVEEGFTEGDYQYGLKQCSVNWGEEAAEYLKDCYGINTQTNRQTLCEDLMYEGYSEAEAMYGVDNFGVNWYHRAVVDADEFVSMLAVPENATPEGVANILSYEDGMYRYGKEQAEYGANYYTNDAVWFLCYWEYCNGTFASESEARQLLKNYKHSSKDIDTAISIFYMHN